MTDWISEPPTLCPMCRNTVHDDDVEAARGLCGECAEQHSAEDIGARVDELKRQAEMLRKADMATAAHYLEWRIRELEVERG